MLWATILLGYDFDIEYVNTKQFGQVDGLSRTKLFEMSRVRKGSIKVPLETWPVPTRAWQRIHVDFAGPMCGSYYMVVLDFQQMAKSRQNEENLCKRNS
ncbi:hypothetical protein TELCIR_01542 [Teladorsagia circumcincta]|uniref:Uncharacterized protein n=1 Tax=Teladorsagia circumcincta TaxID=45464 RepID=A0A2G9V358_TELCI|nr:hypothetical protein TELCIR_01542 [Teladorsagia circumcincta]